MKHLLYILFIVLLNNSIAQIFDDFDSFNGPGEWLSPIQANTGSHNSNLCYNVSGTYLANEWYMFESPVYDFSSWSQVDLLWYQESNIRSQDDFRMYIYDGVGWSYFDLSNLNGLYGLTIPNTVTVITFDLITGNGGGLKNKYCHVEFLEITNNVPLPVELLDFSAELEDGNAALKWSTASEYNNWYFSILKSSNGMVWDHLIDIPGTGMSTSKVEYEYIDKDVGGGYTYYKLKQTDFDGIIDSWNTVYVYKEKVIDPSQEYYDLNGKKVKPGQKGYVISKDGKIHFKYK